MKRGTVFCDKMCSNARNQGLAPKERTMDEQTNASGAQVPCISLLDTLNAEADRCKKMALASGGLPMTMADCFRWKEEAYRHAIHLLSGVLLAEQMEVSNE
jgi:hypothetical protein